MASIAEAFVDLQLDTSGIERQLQELAARLPDIVVKVDGDTNKLRDAIRTTAASLTDLKVKVDGDTSKLRDAVREAARLIGDVTVNVDGDTTKLRDAIARAGLFENVKIKVELDESSVLAVRAKAVLLQRYLIALFDRIPIRLEIQDLTGLLAQVALLRGLLAGIGGAGGGGGGPGLGNLGSVFAVLNFNVNDLVLGLVKATFGTAAMTAAASLLVSVIAALVGATLALTPVLLTIFPAAVGLVGVFGAVALATQGVGAAMDALASGDAKKIKAALADLSPQARIFVQDLYALKPAFDQIQKSVQNTFFNGLGEWLKAAATNLLPAVKHGLDTMASVANTAAGTILHALSLPTSAHELYDTIDNISLGFRAIAGESGNAVRAFLALSSAASGPLGKLLVSLSKDFDDLFASIEKGAADGSIAHYVQDAIDRFNELWSIIKSIISIFGSLVQGADAGGASFRPLADQFQKWADYFASPEGQAGLKTFFANAQSVFEKVTPVIGKVVDILGKVIDFLVRMGPTFATALQQASPFIDAFGKFIDALAPFAGPIAIAIIGILIGFAAAFAVLGAIIGIPIVAITVLIGIIGLLIYGAITGAIGIITNFGAIVGAVGAAFAAAWNYAKGIFLGFTQAIAQGILNIVTGFNNVTKSIAQFLVGIYNSISTWERNTIASIIGWVNSLVSSIRNGWNNAVNAVKSAINGIVSAVTGLVSAVAGAVGRFINAALGIGRGIITGIVSGVSNGASAVINAIVSVASNALAAAKSFLGIASPSKVFESQIAENSMLGWANGITNNAHLVYGALDSVVNGINIAPSLGGLVSPSALNGQIEVSSSASANSRIEKLLQQINDTVKGVGPAVGQTINGVGRTALQGSRV